MSTIRWCRGELGDERGDVYEKGGEQGAQKHVDPRV